MKDDILKEKESRIEELEEEVTSLAYSNSNHR